MYHNVNEIALVHSSYQFAGSCCGMWLFGTAKRLSGSASPKAAESGDAIGAGEKITVLVTDVQDKNWFTLSNGGPDLKYSRLVHEDIFATRGRGD
ncbi:MAG: hypothetical protein CM1200mP15_08690 [Dehalococcoidia bacterium]|nr:MAG: hypothetical protein CM1200mP15_08690 [Dehalococcoidia bacterium]